VLALHKSIAQENKKAGVFRQTLSWVGGKEITKALYVCPPPEWVVDLMDNWLAFINDPNYSPPIKAIVGHARLVSIHLFADGNGRTARLFMDGLLERQSI
jgi:Fic family protein